MSITPRNVTSPARRIDEFDSRIREPNTCIQFGAIFQDRAGLFTASQSAATFAFYSFGGGGGVGWDGSSLPHSMLPTAISALLLCHYRSSNIRQTGPFNPSCTAPPERPRARPRGSTPSEFGLDLVTWQEKSLLGPKALPPALPRKSTKLGAHARRKGTLLN